MAYQSWSVVFGEQPSAAKWNILGTNDAYFSGLLDATGMPLQIVSSATSDVATGTTTIPHDDTVPQNTEGNQYMSLAITPKSATNTLVIDCLLGLSNSSAPNDLLAALFQDSTANAVAASISYMGTATGGVTLSVRHIMTAGTTSSTTFKVRAGGSVAGTTTFNGFGGNRHFGAITKSSMIITEYRA